MQPQQQQPTDTTPEVKPVESTDDWQQPAAPAVSDAALTEQTDSQPLTDDADQYVEASDDDATSPAQEGEEELVRWQAAEHVHREKNGLWYIIFALVILAFVAVAIFLIRSWTFAILVPVMAAALVIYVRRPPAIIDYTLSRKGLHANDKLYSFDTFKEFGLVHDDDENSILLVPRKRFQPGVTVYFPEEVGEVVVDMMAARLPMHEIRLDPIDRLLRRLRI